MLVAVGSEVDDQLDREVQRVERELDRNFDGIQDDVREELDRRLPEPTPTPLSRDVQVVVVVDEHLHDPRGPRRPSDGPTKTYSGSVADEQVDQLLRGRAVDLVGPARAAQPAVEPRVVDVGVEPVLVRRVADAAEARAEVAAARAREVADEHRRRTGCRRA